jgi:hypothetical protein
MGGAMMNRSARAPGRQGRNGTPDETAETELDNGLRRLLGKGAEAYTPAEWAALREQLRLSVLYPGEHVAFRDHWGRDEQLIRREVLFHSRSLKAVQVYLDQLPTSERDGVCLDHVEPDRTR